MTSGLPPVCKLWLGVSKVTLPVKHLAPEILMGDKSSWETIIVGLIVGEVMTSGLPPVCKLWLGVSKVTLPVKHLAPEILMGDNHCGRGYDLRTAAGL